MVSHDAPAVADHVQLAADAVTWTSRSPPLAGKRSEVGDTVNVHVGGGGGATAS